MLSKAFVLVFILFVKDIKGSDSDGFVLHPELRGSLKLHLEPADWLTARINCHNEGSLLASPWSEELTGAIHKLQATEDQSLPVLYSGAKMMFPEGMYTYKKVSGEPALSLEPSDLVEVERCTVFLENGTTSAVACELRFPYVCYKPEAPASPSCGEQTPGYELINQTGQCYKFHTSPRSWLDALRACQEEGAHLAVINSDAEAQALVKLYGGRFATVTGSTYSDVVAIGIYYWRSTGTWWTIHGQTIKQAGYDKWYSGQPISTAHFGFMNKYGTLYTDKGIKQGFICEKKLAVRPA